ncbi:MAG: antitoxin [Candidatus Brocadia sp.]|nr:antitoxin [Candidatus Brocadia sp.]
MTTTDILDLLIPERIQLVENIWDIIAAEADSVELIEEEKKIVDERLEAYHRNPRKISY